MKVRFEDVFLDETKRGHKIQASEYLSAGKYPVIDQGQDQIAGYTNLEDGLFKDVPAIIFGDHTRIIKYIDSPFFLGADGVKVLKSKINATDYKYLFYCLQNAKIPNTGYNRHFKWLKDVYIPLPPLDEQRRIAAVLDKVSDLIAKRRAQLDKLDELVKARFVEMFGDPVTNPHRYPVYQLSDYIEFLTSGSRGWTQYFSDEGEYFITIKNVKNCRITLDDVQHIVPPNNAEAVRTKVQEGDLLISITADLGRTGVVTKEIANHGAYINQHLACIRLNQKAVLSLYVACFMESDAGKEQFQAKNQNAVKAGLNFNSINTLRLMVPPIEHQSAFITFVKQIDKLKLTIQQSLDKLEILKKALMQEYFYIGDDENDG